MVILGLGTNLGDRERSIRLAVEELRGFVHEIRESSIIETEALLPKGAPQEWNKPFLNMAVAGTCSLGPLELFQAIKAIEEKLGRASRGHWGPREIDIDILAMDALVLNDPQLTIPHKELLNRSFALLPLAELAPGWCYPVVGEHFGKTARELALAL